MKARSPWWQKPGGRPSRRSMRLPIVWDEGPNAKVSSETIAATLKEGLDAEQAYDGNKEGDVKAAIAGAVEKGRGNLFLSFPEPCLHGADECHRAMDGGQMRGLVPDAER